jgi:hypothetical protein
MALGSGSSLATDCSTRRRGSPFSLQLCSEGKASLLYQVSSQKPTAQESESLAVILINRSRRPFIWYSGLGLLIQRLARSQHTPNRAKVARTGVRESSRAALGSEAFLCERRNSTRKSWTISSRTPAESHLLVCW